jgi:hypothetical protein
MTRSFSAGASTVAGARLPRFLEMIRSADALAFARVDEPPCVPKGHADDAEISVAVRSP